MKQIFACLTAVVLAGLLSTAGASEAGVPTSALKIYSGGVAGGAMYSLNDELKEDIGDVFGKFAIVNVWEFQPNLALFADVNWYIAGGESLSHFGFDAGLDYFFSPESFRPFIGAGVGAHYFDREYRNDGNYYIQPRPELEFGDRFGLSLTAHAGFTFEVTESWLIRLRVPFHVVLNTTTDMGVGVDFSLMYADKFRKVRKLNY